MARTIPPGTISSKGAMNEWGINEKTFVKLMNQNKIKPAVKQGNRSCFYPRGKSRKIVLAYLKKRIKFLKMQTTWFENKLAAMELAEY